MPEDFHDKFAFDIVVRSVNPLKGIQHGVDLNLGHACGTHIRQVALEVCHHCFVHVRQIMRKCGASNRTQAVVSALK